MFTLSQGCLSLKLESWTRERTVCLLVDAIGLLFAVIDGIGLPFAVIDGSGLLFAVGVGLDCAERGGEFGIARIGW